MRLTNEEIWEKFGPDPKDVASGIKDYLLPKEDKEIRVISENTDSIQLKRNYQGKYGFECKVYFDSTKEGEIDKAIERIKEMVKKIKDEFLSS